ncbi:MAG: precorrin-2 dehydrogenase/sirohydrochlorin ferrochelatase family protein [Acidimicrobiales bacterium]
MPIKSTTYPVNLILAGRSCLVVGGGPIAARKAAGLLGCEASVHLVATEVGAEVRALGGGHGSGVGTAAEAEPSKLLRKVGLTWYERPYRPADIDGRCLVVVATDDRALNRAVAADAEAAGVWVNVADDPDACGFILPAILREGPVTVSVSTGGHSPALAGWLRDRIAEVVGPEHAQAATMISEARDELRVAGRSTEGLDWQSALDSDMLGSIRAGQVGHARERLRACLSL